MIDMNERMPYTPENVRRAQDIAGPDGEWSDHIDWWGNSSDVMPVALRIAEAIRSGADVSPELRKMVVIKPVLTKSSGLEARRKSCGIVGEDGKIDIPFVPRIPNDFRANLPA